MNIYEWCLESYLSYRRQAFCRMRDVVRASTGSQSLKNFDYLVGTDAGALILEVKGRSFPTANGGRWENWMTGDDMDSLETWGAQLGEHYTPVVAFIYRIRTLTAVPDRPWTPVDVEGERFGIVACQLADYRRACRRRSVKWNTFTVPRERFVKLVQPLEDLLPAGHYDVSEPVDLLIRNVVRRLGRSVRVGDDAVISGRKAAKKPR